MADDMTLTVGHRLGPYRVTRVLGSGTFGNVYLCADDDDREVVLREYMPRGLAVRGADGSVGPQMAAAEGTFRAGLEGFVARAERMAGIAHPNIVRIHRVFSDRGTAYVVMDYVPGTSLAASLESSERLPQNALAEVLLPVLDGLQAMHRDGLAHGSIGLGSIVAGLDGTPVLLGVAVPPRDEFGMVARPNYAPIERYSAQGGLADQRTDVYSIGAVMYRCLAGVAPPEAPLRAERDTLVPAARAVGRRSGYSDALTAAVDASLAVQPQDRPETLDGLRAALGAGAEQPEASEPKPGDAPEDADEQEKEGQPPPASGLRGRLPKGPAKSPRIRNVAFAGAAALALVVAGIVLFRSDDQPPQERPPVAAQPTPVDSPPDIQPSAAELPATPVRATDGALEPSLGDDAAPRVSAVADAAPSADGDAPATLVVETTPPGARVLLDGDDIGETPLLASVPGGDRVVTLEHPQFDPVELARPALAPGEELRIDRQLVRSTGALQFAGTPAHAWIEHDGQRVADGLPATLEGIPTGAVLLEAGADGHHSATITVDVRRDVTETVEIELERMFGTLNLFLEPADARVLLANGEDPYLPGMEIAHGTHRVDISREGYRSASRTFEVAGATIIAVTLEPVPQPLTILTDPRGAAVEFVDAPLSYFDGILVLPGEYALRADLPGYASWSGTVAHGNAPTEHAVTLEFVSAQYADPLRVGGSGPTMTIVPAGTFSLGCGSGPACATSGDSLSPVTFQAPFALSKHEVTFEEFDRFATATGRTRPGDGGWGRGQRPVINVSWRDATAYATWLTEQTGREYRLATEAEWEYAARADTATAYHWGDAAGTGQANCDGCGGRATGRTLPAGSFDANAWGLHDMHGNVWEWVQDCWNDRPAAAPSNAAPVPGDCDRRVLRGGSWFNAASFARSASRLSGNPDVRGTIAGFRVAASDLTGVGTRQP